MKKVAANLSTYLIHAIKVTFTNNFNRVEIARYNFTRCKKKQAHDTPQLLINICSYQFALAVLTFIRNKLIVGVSRLLVAEMLTLLGYRTSRQTRYRVRNNYRSCMKVLWYHTAPQLPTRNDVWRFRAACELCTSIWCAQTSPIFPAVSTWKWM